MKPSPWKVSIGYRSPVSTISISIGCGSIHSRGIAHGLPRPAIRVSVMPTCVPFRPTRRSEFRLSIMPPAIRWPVIAAMIGLATRRWRPWNGSFILVRMSTPSSFLTRDASRRSSPAQKVPQSAEVRMATRTFLSASTSPHRSCSRLAAAGDSALRISGRLIFTVAMPSRTSYRTVSASFMSWSPGTNLLRSTCSPFIRRRFRIRPPPRPGRARPSPRPAPTASAPRRRDRR